MTRENNGRCRRCDANRAFLLFEIVLLGSNHRARPTDPQPGYHFSSGEFVMFHQVCANQSARPAQTRCKTQKA